MTHLPTPSSATSIDEASTYSKPRIVLHWLSAAVILWATLSGFGVVLMDPTHPFRQWVESINPQVTSLFIPLFAWRLWLAIQNGPRRAHDNAHQRLASATHKAMYAAVSGVLVTGVLMMSHPVTLLALVKLPQLVHSEMALMRLHDLHHVLCAILAGLVTLHLAAVVMHQVRGRSVLGKMKVRNVAR